MYYRIEMWDGGRWVELGGKFNLSNEAYEKITQYHQYASTKKAKQFRVIHR